ncbi:sensor domain-containing diguanylate cyclase [Tsuneonella sp. HG222]
MAGWDFVRICALLALASLLACARPAFAASPSPLPAAQAAACHASSDTSLEMRDLARVEWTCRQGDWSNGAPVAWLKFPAGKLGKPATEFSSRITVFRAIEIAAVDRDGNVRSRQYTPEDAEAVVDGAVFRLAMPEAPPGNAFWVVRIERPHSLTVQSEARISHSDYRSQGSLLAIAILTLVLGMLVTPLLFDINFYVVLRERFVLLHAGMVIAMIAYLLFAGGLIALVAKVPITLMAVASPLSWAIGVGLAGFFIRAFLEEDALSRTSARVLTFTAWWTVLVPGFAALQLDATQPIDNQLYFYSFLPVIPVYSIIILRAALRGSRSGRFLAAAWAPIIIASAERLLRGLGVYVGPSSLDHTMFVAMGIEVIIIALGVADRFLSLRRQRDMAVDEARVLEELSERDPMTGLYNRRMLEDRFALLRAEGFTTLAIVDLDRFKSVNDTHGHGMGDKVIQAAARALDPDDDVLAFRLGGEEFLILMRGADVTQRAERRRQGIPARIANEVAGLDRMVTASMGLIEVPRNAMPNATFAQLYERADRLLYEAKQTGRNRTVNERMRVFSQRRTERRKSAEAA